MAQTDRPTDRQTITVIELSWTAKKEYLQKDDNHNCDEKGGREDKLSIKKGNFHSEEDSLIFGNFINLNLLEKKNHTWIILTKRKKTENVEKSRIITTIQSNN